MPAPFHPNVMARAKEMWLESEANSPQRIVDNLCFELGYGVAEWTKNLPDGTYTRLPKDRSTINKVATREGWPPHTKPNKFGNDDTDVLIQPTCMADTFPIEPTCEDSIPPEPELFSGIADPIWHLSKILAKKKAHEYNYYEGPLRVATLQQQMMAIQMDVASEYEPHPKMFGQLRPLIRQYLIRERASYRRYLQKLKDETVIKDDGTGSRDLGFYDLDEERLAYEDELAEDWAVAEEEIKGENANET